MEFSWTTFPDLTLLIRRFHGGDKDAETQFFRVAYQHLKTLAGMQLQRESRRNETSAQDLLHDVYIGRIRSWTGSIRDRNHYAALVCLAVRQELCDQARRRGAKKRAQPASMSARQHGPAANIPVEEVLTVERKLEQLGRIDARAAQVVWLRYYGGCSWLETAAVVGASLKAVRNDWEFAEKWLRKQLGRRLS